jgi:hypothetical protein
MLGISKYQRPASKGMNAALIEYPHDSLPVDLPIGTSDHPLVRMCMAFVAEYRDFWDGDDTRRHRPATATMDNFLRRITDSDRIEILQEINRLLRLPYGLDRAVRQQIRCLGFIFQLAEREWHFVRAYDATIAAQIKDPYGEIANATLDMLDPVRPLRGSWEPLDVGAHIELGDLDDVPVPPLPVPPGGNGVWWPKV